MDNISDNEDIIAHYENEESDSDHINLEKEEAASDDNDNDKIETARRIDPSTSKTHIVRNPMPKLNTERLKGLNGIQTIEKYFEDFKYSGKGQEKLDLDRIMKRLEHWSYRLFPKYHFDDFLTRAEQLGVKKDLQVYIKKYRLDIVTSDNNSVIHDNTDNEEDQEQSAPLDDFDLLITEQIQKQKQTATRYHISVATSSTSNEDAFNHLLMQSDSTSSSQIQNISTSKNELSDEVKEKIERNKQMAIQRKLQRQRECEDIKRKKLENKNVDVPSEYNNPISYNDENASHIGEIATIESQINENKNEITSTDKTGNIIE